MSTLPAFTAVCGAIVAGIVDARTGFIPNRVTAITATAALTTAIVGGDGRASVLGALLAGGILFGLYAVTRGRGLGLGDVKLAGAIGAGLGPAGAPIALGAAFAMGGAYAVWLLATRRARRGDAIRFGPFLAVGSLAAVFAR